MAVPSASSAELDRIEGKNSSILLWITLALLLATAGTLFAINDKIGAIVMIPLALGAFFGHRSGAWKMLSVLIGSISGYYLASPAAARLAPLFEDALGRSISNSALEHGVSGFVAGIAVTIVLLCFGWLVISRIRLLKSLDKNLGLAIGVSKSFALVAVALWTVLAMEPRMIDIRGKQRIKDESTQANLYHQFLNVSDATRKSPVLSYLTHWNPIATNPQLNELLNKGQAMVLDLQSQVTAAQSMSMGGDAKLTGLFNELQSQGTRGVPPGFSKGANVNDTLSSGGIGAMLQKLGSEMHP